MSTKIPRTYKKTMARDSGTQNTQPHHQSSPTARQAEKSEDERGGCQLYTSEAAERRLQERGSCERRGGCILVLTRPDPHVTASLLTCERVVLDLEKPNDGAEAMRELGWSRIARERRRARAHKHKQTRAHVVGCVLYSTPAREPRLRRHPPAGLPGRARERSPRHPVSMGNLYARAPSRAWRRRDMPSHADIAVW